MNKNRIRTGALLGALAVALGAFGSHALKDKLSEDYFRAFQTGVQYQFYHAMAICITGLTGGVPDARFLKWSYMLFIAGIILFCGSLYLLTFFRVSGNESAGWLGIITPFGGMSFIAGWVCLAYSLYRKA